MAEETSLNHKEKQIVSLLEQLHPRTNAGDRDRLMFAAGRRSAGHVRRWQGISSILLVCLVCSLVIRPPVIEETRLENTVPLANDIRNGADQMNNSRHIDELAFIHVRHRVLHQGLEALPDRSDRFTGMMEGMDRTEVLNNFMAL